MAGLSPVHLLMPATLTAFACWQPLPLYLAALALFGLPHVIWEAGFLRSRYAGRWPWQWWLALWGLLLGQAGVRTAIWLGHYPADAGMIVDVLALALLGAIVALAPRGTGWLARGGGVLVAVSMFWLLQHGEVLTALLLLALLHNFTPLAMAWDMARDGADPEARKLAWHIGLLFGLPLVLASGLLVMPALPSLLASHGPLLDSQLPAAWDGAHRPALLSAMVLAQCLHYYCVLLLLPDAERRRTGRPLLRPSCRYGAVAVSALLFAYYLHDYASARQLYAVAAGIHAWIEWPVLMMTLLSLDRSSRVRTTRHPSAGQ